MQSDLESLHSINDELVKQIEEYKDSSVSTPRRLKNVKWTLIGRRNAVKTLKRRCNNVVLTLCAG